MNTPPPFPNWEKTKTTVAIRIPTVDGSATADSFDVSVSAWKDRDTGEIFLTNEVQEEIEKIKARRMGLFSPTALKALREYMGLSQAVISDLLQIGEKTWSSWETGKQRQSRAMNLVIRLLFEGWINPITLKLIAEEQIRY